MRKSTLLLLVLVLGAAAAGLLWALGSGEPGPLPAPAPDAGRSVAPVGPLRIEGEQSAGAPLREAVARRLDPGQAEADYLADPQIREALAGFRGRVVDAGGKPVPDCGVRIFRLAADALIRPGMDPFRGGLEQLAIVAGETETDRSGLFFVDGIWPRGIYVMLAGIGTDAPTHRILQRTPGPGEIVDLGDVPLAEGAVVTGTVVDEGGEPVAGAMVRGVDLPGQITGMLPIERFDPEGVLILRESGAPTPVIEMPSWVRQIWDNLPVPSTTTDAEGRFRLTGLAAGPNMIAATRDGLLPAVLPSVPLRAGQERDLGRLRLREGEEVLGLVQDTAGRPVPGAEVVAAPTTTIAPLDFGSRIGVTDAEGRFAAAGFPDGKVTVAARRPGGSWIVAKPQSIYQDVVLVLPATFRIDVAVLGAGGTPVEEPELRLLPGSGDDGTLEMAMLGFLPEVDLEQRLQKLEDGRLRITGLTAGKYYLLAEAEGYGTGSAPIDLQGDQEVALSLPERKTYRVRVVDDRGAGIRHAAIYVRQFGPSTAEMPLHCGYTGGDGRLLVERTFADKVRITAEHPAYGLVHGEAGFGGPETVLVMQPPGTIEGVVTEGGRPPAPGAWTVVLWREDSGQRGALEGVPVFAVPDLEGAFTARGLQPGTWNLMLIKSLDAVRSFGSMFSVVGDMALAGDRPEVEAAVPPGGTASVHLEASAGRTFDGPSARIAGSVFVDGALAEGMTVFAWSEKGRFVAKVDPTGRFDLGLLPAGHVSLHLLDSSAMGGLMYAGGNGALWSRDLELQGGVDQDLQIDVQTASLSGVVVGPDGSPIPQAWVTAVGSFGTDGDQSWFNATTDSEGRFRFARVPAGSYKIDVRARGEGRAGRGAVTGIRVAPGLSPGEVRITLQRTVTVSGRVDLSRFGSERPDWIGVSFQLGDAEDAEFVDTAHVADDGTFSTDDLLPGTYRLAIHYSGNQDQELVHPEPVVVGPEGLQGLVVVPTPKSGGR